MYVPLKPVSFYLCALAQTTRTLVPFLKTISLVLDCPNGHGVDKPLFLQKDAFEGEQWAPWSSYDNNDVDITNTYILVGTLNGDALSTCRKYEDLNDGKSPSWTVDNSQTKLKKHILCCMDPNKLTEKAVVSKGMNSIWLDESHGWNGGSYSDGEQFCEGLGGKKLCPYTACKLFALTF
jgi:hypothetical protein